MITINFMTLSVHGSTNGTLSSSRYYTTEWIQGFLWSYHYIRDMLLTLQSRCKKKT